MYTPYIERQKWLPWQLPLAPLDRRLTHDSKLDRFSCFCTDDRRVSHGTPLPSKLPLLVGISGPRSNTWFPGPTRVLNPSGIWIGSAIFARHTSVTDRLTDRPTDHATRSVTIGRIYVRSTAMRPNNNITHCLLYTSPSPRDRQKSRMPSSA